MVSLVIEPEKTGQESLAEHLRGQLAALDPECVVRVQLSGPYSARAGEALSAAQLRELAPPSMNVSLAPPRIRSAQS
jgi:hypothetical protein